MAGTILKKGLLDSATAQQFQVTRNYLTAVSHACNKPVYFKGRFIGTVQPQQQLV